MGDSGLEEKFKDLKISEKMEINILLIGETGVGKSTFISAFANYLIYVDFKKAEKEKLNSLMPSEFRMTDKYNRNHIVKTGEVDKNECLTTGVSATQDVKAYVFPLCNGKLSVRLIDTPGMGDTRGIHQDDTNCDNILKYIGNLHELHAICFLLKPNEPRNTVLFRYCLTQIFSRLDKSASDNIIFCFTNTRGHDYGPGETIRTLKSNIVEIENISRVRIPLNRNIFCFDNESYKYLAAVKQGVQFDDEIKARNKESWKKSTSECWRLIRYIVGDHENNPIKPHFVKSTSAVNEARRMICQLTKPLADITQLIHHNQNTLERHMQNLADDNASIEEMKKNLYMPVITLVTTQLTQPVTVCTARKCAQIYKVGGNDIWHYKQRCHDPCYLNNVEREEIGAPQLRYCKAMNGTTTCTKCFCEFMVHMHVYYFTKTKEIKEKDKNIENTITTREQLLEKKKKLISSIENKKAELDDEHTFIIKTCAKFAHFVQSNAITPFNDAYRDYIQYLIQRELSFGDLHVKETVKKLEQLLRQYEEQKKSFDKALEINKKIGQNVIVTAGDITKDIQNLYKLKNHGKKIKELFDCQKASRKKEFKNTEMTLSIPHVSKDENKKKEDKKNKEKDDNKNNEKGDKKNKEKADKKNKEKADTKKNKETNDDKSCKQSKGSNDKKGKEDNGNRKTNYNGNANKNLTHEEPPPSYQETQGHTQNYSSNNQQSHSTTEYQPLKPNFSANPNSQPYRYDSYYQGSGSHEYRGYSSDPNRPYVDPNRPYVDPKRPYVDSRPPYVDSRPPYVDSRPPYVDSRPPYVDPHRPYTDSYYNYPSSSNSERPPGNTPPLMRNFQSKPYNSRNRWNNTRNTENTGQNNFRGRNRGKGRDGGITKRNNSNKERNVEKKKNQKKEDSSSESDSSGST